MALRSKLAIIVHADVVDSTSLVQRDERIAHERIQASFRRLSGAVSDYDGTTREVRGDALLAEFERASDAVSAALAFQVQNRSENDKLDSDIRPELRIGIALGEVVIADRTLTGAGVVLAQRLEQLATPGGLCISGAVREALPARLPFEYVPLGEQTLKGFVEPVQVFSVSLNAQAVAPPPEPKQPYWRRRKSHLVALAVALLVAGVVAWIEPWQTRMAPADVSKMAHPLPDRPSVAVLPFRNISADKEQEYFSDAMTEQVITDLSKLSGVFVVASESSSTYRDQSVKLRQVAEDLGVRYLLEGSVQRGDGQLRVTAQLVDAVQGRLLWAERYDGQLDDVFKVQSEVASKVAKALSVTLSANEVERMLQKYTSNLEAYDVYLKARRIVDAPTRENVERAEVMFQQVIQLDPQFAGGYAGLSYTYNIRARFRYGDDPQLYRAKALEFANKAVEVDPAFGGSYIALGGAHLANHDPLGAVDAARKALTLEPNGYFPHLYLGFYLQFAGEAALAVEHLERANRISPLGSVRNLAFLGRAYLLNEDYQKAADTWAKRYRDYPNSSANGFVYAAAAFTLAGDTASAAAIVDKLLTAFPDFRLSKWGYINLYRLERDRMLIYEGARKAGIPE